MFSVRRVVGSELTAAVNQKSFCFLEGNTELSKEKVATRGLCAFVQSRVSMLQTPRRACSMRTCCGVL